MSFIEAFRETARRRGDAPALLHFGRRAFTYRSLAERAASIAGALRGEKVVGIALPKSPDYVAAVLGAWWAGAAFVPLDPSLPEERRRFMARDAGVTRIVDRAFRPGRPAAPARLRPGDLAYVIFTSGSTGRPKGVRVEHRGIMNVFRAQIPAFGLGPHSRSLFYLSISFDASISVFGTALLAGAALCIEAEPALRRLPEIAARRRITHVDLPPSLLPSIDPRAMPRCLETVVIGGEVCPPDAVRRWARRFRVVNVYGPTETTICTSLCRCDPETWERPLLGDPVPGIEYRAVRGELWIGGAGVARGYCNRSSRKFAGGWYRTGDRVVEGPQGLEFAGRIDRQVKLRGLRIEPGEVEARLLRIPGVREAAVVKRPIGRREGLVAFVAGGNGAAARLGRFLPRWMIPQRFEPVDRLPRVASGKPDYPALERRPLGIPEGEARGLAGIWARVLGVRPGRRDTFASLGGDSLAALEVLTAAEREGLALLPSWMTPGATIEDLEGRRGAGEGRSAASLLRDLPAVSVRHAWPEGPARAIFMTGATGFLGGRLLNVLLGLTRARVYCLARDPRRLPKSPRVVAVEGDLERPRFGLSRVAWRELAGGIDAVWHLGARVHIGLSCEALWAANVGGTCEALRLVAEGAPKRLHYASTLSVFVGTDRNTGLLREDDDLRRTRTVWGGYAQSKWAAEMLVRRSGATAAVYRLGLLTGDGRTGRMPESGHFSLFVKGTAATGCIPRGSRGLRVDVTPVDFAAAAMARLALSAGPGTYHLANPRSLRLGTLADAMGVEEVPVDEWRERAEGAGEEGAAVLLALSRMLPRSYGRWRGADLFEATGARFGMKRALAGLAGSGIVCPPPERYLDLYLSAILT